ncbi:hypothetical protein RU95_GL004287 [Enterococcus avium]|nr:hypothetical protein RU95_GL004287 [Enterococcus avium]
MMKLFLLEIIVLLSNNSKNSSIQQVEKRLKIALFTEYFQSFKIIM